MLQTPHIKFPASRYFDYLLVWIVAVLALAIFYRSFLTSTPIDIPDDVLPLLSRNWGLIFSDTEPWYTLVVNLLFFYDGAFFGISVNVLQVFLISLAPVTMYILLQELEIAKPLRGILSIFYIINSVIFPNVFIFNPLMWPEFYIFMPILGLFLLKFQKSGDFTYLFYFIVLLSFYMEIQTSPNFYNLRLILPYLGLLFLVSSYYGIRKNTASYKVRVSIYIAILVIFFILNFIPILYVLGYSSQISTLPIKNISNFYAFHIANVIYTYQSQNFLFAVSGIVVYPNYSNTFLEGFHQKFFSFTLAFVIFTLIMFFISFYASLRKHKDYRFMMPLLISTVLIWIFIASVQAGILLPLFKISDLFFLWEYPGYLETPLMFLYVIIYAYSITFLIDTQKNKANLAGPDHGIKRGNRRIVTSFVVLFIILLLTFSPIIATSPHGFSSPSSSSVLPKSYDSLGAFFSNKSGNFEILPVPVNESIYTRLETLVNPDKVYVLPYAYQNNPLSYPNVTLYNSIYTDIYDTNFNTFQPLLKAAFIKYVIVFDPSANYKYIEAFSKQNYLVQVLNESNFVIFQYKLFSTAISSEPVSVQSSTAGIPGGYRSSNISLINSSSSLSSIGFNTSISKYTPLAITKGDLNLSVLNNNTGTAQYSEIYKFTYIPPGSNLNLSIEIDSQYNSKSYLFLIYHDNLSRMSVNNIYSANQNYQPIPTTAIGNFTVNTIAPADAEYLYFGILTLNITKGNGSLLFSSLSIKNVVDTLNNSRLSSNNVVPIAILNNVPIQNLTLPGIHYKPLNLAFIADNMSINNLSFDPHDGYVGLHNVTFRLPGSSGFGQTGYYLVVNVLNDSVLKTNMTEYNSSNNNIIVVAQPHTEISVSGFAIIRAIWEYAVNATLPDSITYVYTDSSELINASGNFTIEVTTLDTNKISFQNVTVLKEFTENTQSVYILRFHGNSAVKIEIRNNLNKSVIMYNIFFISTFVAFVIWVISRNHFGRLKLG